MAFKLETPAGGAPELVGLYKMFVDVILFQRSRCGMAIEVGRVELPPVAIRRAGILSLAISLRLRVAKAS